MNADRDFELGAALRRLPTPDHDPAFWVELEQRLAGEPPAPSTTRAPRLDPRTMWFVSAAAAVALVLAAASVMSILDGDGATRLRVAPPATAPQGPPWTTLSESPLSARIGHTAVWTGRKMLVWGGSGPGDRLLADGAAYDPSNDRWEPMADAPTGPLVGATAVWTGRKMLVWGGRLGTEEDPTSEAATGAAYDPASDTWAPISPSPLRTVAGHAAVWTGERMLVWGGSVGELPVADGAAYDPDTDRWTTLAPAPIEPRFDHTAVWTGDQMIVWGGFSGEESESRAAFADGAAYDPATGAWTMLPSAPIAARALHMAVWTGGSMVVWGGTGQGLSADGASYEPATGSWEVLPPSPLAPRIFATAVAAEGSMLVWGGAGDQGDARSDGFSYDAVPGRWVAVPESALSARSRHSAVWTGTSMIVWGGLGEAEAMHSDGAAMRLEPSGPDATSPTSAAGNSR